MLRFVVGDLAQIVNVITIKFKTRYTDGMYSELTTGGI